jgi:Ca2+-binding RTX toxin-like protein
MPSRTRTALLAAVSAVLLTTTPADARPHGHGSKALFEPARSGPLRVGAGPTDIEVKDWNPGYLGDESDGDWNNDTIVLNGGAGTYTQFQGYPYPSLHKVSTTTVATNPQDFLLEENTWAREVLLVADTGGDRVEVVADPKGGRGVWSYAPLFSVAVGDAPQAIARAGVTDLSLNTVLSYAVANAGSDDLTLLQGNSAYGLTVLGTVAVGDAPSDVLDTGQGLLVANSGSDTVTVLSQLNNGHFENLTTIPVGRAPSALAPQNFVRSDNDPEVAVANSGSDTVSILDSTDHKGNYGVAGTYPVGNAPSALVGADFDRKDGPDLAVANSGSNDVSILLNNGDGTMRPGGTFPVGKRPSAISLISFDPYFSPDLAVANAGSNDLTVLLRHEPGRCQGHEAYVRHGSPRADKLNGGGGPSLVAGRGGNDTIRGSGGGDCLSGGPGADEINGLADSDVLSGGPGNDELTGKNGRDRLFGGAGNDELIGGLGFAALAKNLRDFLVGGPGRDRIDPGFGRDTVEAGPGNDLIRAHDGTRDVIDCGAGSDRVSQDRVDVLRGCEHRLRG